MGLQLLSYKFRKIKDWLNPRNDKNKVPQNHENKLTVTFFKGLFKYAGVGIIFRRDDSMNIKINWLKIKKNWEDVKRYHFVCLALTKFVLLQ